MWSVVVLAQSDPAVAGDVAASSGSVWEFLVKGGVMMIPIGLCSLIVLAVGVERAFMLRHAAAIPDGLADRVGKALRKGARGRAEAMKHARAGGGALGRVFEAGLKQFGKPTATVERHLASAGETELAQLRSRFRVLSVIAAVAPLLGLVGTILGMITAFQTVAVSADALGKTELLAKGIYEAMITTAAGLLVAIPTLVTYHWLNARLERITRSLDRACVEVLDYLASDTPGAAVSGGSLEEDAAPVNGEARFEAEPEGAAT